MTDNEYTPTTAEVRYDYSIAWVARGASRISKWNNPYRAAEIREGKN